MTSMSQLHPLTTQSTDGAWWTHHCDEPYRFFGRLCEEQPVIGLQWTWGIILVCFKAADEQA